ncbi:glycoside hydrolase family 5 protein [Archangium minus]|uniref:Glycoside hydrolase family 5 protein n=1 Tax=Archangium minus TaxID=83450 RepID=A0ABY9X5P9_9BACT|nr:glycoside hydrolase family 5 protein [Archangium minus]
MRHSSIQRLFLTAILLLLCAPLTASALTFVNRGAFTGPQQVSSGQTVYLTLAVESPEAVSNVTFSLQVRKFSASGEISPSAVHSQSVTGQSFAAGVAKQYSWGFTIPNDLVTGDYVWVIKATNATGSLVYLDIAKTVSNYTFHVNGVPAKRYVRGINVMDLVIGSSVLPGVYGTNYTMPSQESLRNLKSRGHNVIRVPFNWERIQPVLNGGLNTSYLGYLLQTLENANAVGLGVIVDMHNYGRYTSNGQTSTFGSAALKKESYADAWRRIASAIKSNPKAYAAVYAYDIMNEPHDLPYLEGNFLNPVGVSSFESSVEGWLPRDASNTSLSKVSRNNQGSLKITASAPVKNGVVLGASLWASTKSTSITSGKTFQAKVFVPTTTPGAVIKARMVMFDSGSKSHFSKLFTVTKGVDTRVYYAPPDAVWQGNRGISIEFIVDGTEIGASHVFYVDNVSQGTQTDWYWPEQVWENYSQAAVDAIRALPENKLIMVEGYSYSSAERWPENHPQKWIKDPLNNIMYHAHLYMDGNSGGKYEECHSAFLAGARSQGYDSVGKLTIARAKNFTDWVTAQGTYGFIGEYGWPNEKKACAGESAAWNADGEEFLSFLDSIGMGATMWTTGSWEQQDSPYFNELSAYQLLPTFVPLSSAKVIERHPGQP